MTDCFVAWGDNFYACTDATGGLSIPGAPTPETLNDRIKICATPACQKLFSVFRELIASKCQGALDEVQKFPNGMYTTTFCPATPAPSPNSTATTNGTAIVAPTVSPVPAPAIIAKGGLSTTTIAGIGVGVVVVLLVIIIVLLVWRKRKDKLDQPPGTDIHNGFAYANLSDARTDDTFNGSDFLRGGLALAAVRIPAENLKLGKVISHGGFGEVLVGVYNNETVAIKRLLPSKRKDGTQINSFFKEIRLTATLEHECIVRFIGVSWDVPANLMMISEFMHGGDLRALLMMYSRDGHANGHEDTKLRMAVQVAHALTYLHSLDTPVVHRDLKSKNILLTESLDAKVIDFGISCERQDVTMTAGVGTSLWMAPEVMLGTRYDEKADVFSFGVILSELDTHQLPYDHAVDPVSNKRLADIVMMNLIVAGELKPRFTSMAATDMVDLANACLEIDPAKRPRASEVLYRIHLSRQDDPTMTSATRSAIRRSMHTAETSTRTRNAATAAPSRLSRPDMTSAGQTDTAPFLTARYTEI